MKNTKQAKFFCENCGSEVPENAKLCKKCGKFFISVRCPNCGKTGTSREFKDGCTQCGYAVGKPGSAYAGISAADKAKALSSLLSGAKSELNSKNTRHAFARQSSESLPVWIYAVTGILLLTVVIGIYSCIRLPA